jgi:hypothetical protein
MPGRPPEGERGPEREQAIEVMPYSELLTKVGEKMLEVTNELEKERKLSAEIRAMGGKITPDTADRLRALEGQKNDLLRVWDQTLEPARKDAAMAFIDNAEWLVEKPEDLEKMMTDPETLELSDEDLIEVQTAEDLKKVETALQEELDKTQEEMADIIEQMHEAKNWTPKVIEDIINPPDPQLRDAWLGVMEARFGEMHNYVKAINEKLKEVRLNLGFAEKMEGKKAA